MNTINPGSQAPRNSTGLKLVPKRAAEGEEPKIEDRIKNFANLPHADFETNLAKLRSGIFKSIDGNDEKLLQKDDYNEALANKDVCQAGWQQALTADLGNDLVKMQFAQDVSDFQGMIPTTSQLQREFDKLSARQDIPFEYIYDGCYARAHLMCDEMNRDNINNAKMFVMVQNPYDASSRLEASNKYMDAKWWYHVAPMVFAQDEATKTVQPFIMDPSMSDHPLTPQEWIHQMWDENDKIKVDVTRNPQYGPLESGGQNETFEESVEPSKEILAEYSKDLENIKEQYEHDHPDQPKKAA